MGFFFVDSDGDKHIKHEELQGLFRQIPGLDFKEREFLKGKFDRYEGKNIRKTDLLREIQDMERHDDDDISHDEAEKVKRKLLENLHE